ncbi:hypothetical protein KSP39_PZI001490 [Platanthera zijinensis]|uniref:Uncharacterized protein n=1 Tax=Platanthera zijinensis TaxID=2320716 RepID=A0AAP0C2W2_9ASPA
MTQNCCFREMPNHLTSRSERFERDDCDEEEVHQKCSVEGLHGKLAGEVRNRTDEAVDDEDPLQKFQPEVARSSSVFQKKISADVPPPNLNQCGKTDQENWTNSCKN